MTSVGCNILPKDRSLSLSSFQSNRPLCPLFTTFSRAFDDYIQLLKKKNLETTLNFVNAFRQTQEGRKDGVKVNVEISSKYNSFKFLASSAVEDMDRLPRRILTRLVTAYRFCLSSVIFRSNFFAGSCSDKCRIQSVGIRLIRYQVEFWPSKWRIGMNRIKMISKLSN